MYLYPLRNLFCEQLSISLTELIQRTDLRKKFIAIAIKLFNPEYITGYQNALKDNVAEQISELLHCDRTWVSQNVSYAIDIFNPSKAVANAYLSDRKELQGLAPVLFEKIKEERSIIRRTEGRVAEMFTD